MMQKFCGDFNGYEIEQIATVFWTMQFKHDLLKMIKKICMFGLM